MRRALAIAILGSAIVAAWFIVSGNTPHAAPIPALPIAAPAPVVSTALEMPVNTTTLNATDELGARVGTLLAQELAQGSQPAADMVAEASLLDQNQMAALNAFFTVPEINVDAIKVTYEDGPAAWESYLKNTSTIIRNAFAPISVGSDFFSSYTAEDFAKLDAAYNSAIDELLSLVVPRRFRALHEERLQLITAQRNIMNAFARASDDPVAAYVAVGAFQEVNDNFSALKSALETFASEHKLAI